MKKELQSTGANANNPWFAVAMVLLGVIGGFLVANVMNSSSAFGIGQQVAGNPQVPPSAPPSLPPPTGDLAPVDPAVDRIRGNSNARIALIEYSDFECPFCARVHDTYKQLLQEYGDEVMWVYRHFPLTSIHPNATKAAEASECAGELGGDDAFWTFTDLLFAQGVNVANFPAQAAQAGVDQAAFTECLDSGRYAEKVANDLRTGAAAGVQGTPGNFIVNRETNERRDVPGAQPFSAFQAAIEAVR